MTYEVIKEGAKINLDETFGFRGGNSRSQAISELKNAIRCNDIKRVPEDAVIYVEQVTPKRYEAYIGVPAPEVEVEENDNLPAIIPEKEMQRYIENLPGKTVQEKLRSLRDSVGGYGSMSEESVQKVLDALSKGDQKTSAEKDEAIDSLDNILL